MKMRSSEYAEKSRAFRMTYRLDSYGDVEFRWAWLWLIIPLACVFLIYFGLVGACHMGAPCDQTSIDVHREALHELDVCDRETREHIIYHNHTVMRNRAYNKTWYGGLIVPDSWDDVQLIPLDNKSCYESTELKDVNLNVSGLGDLIEEIQE